MTQEKLDYIIEENGVEFAQLSKDFNVIIKIMNYSAIEIIKDKKTIHTIYIDEDTILDELGLEIADYLVNNFDVEGGEAFCENCENVLTDDRISDDFTIYDLCSEECWEEYDSEGYNHWLANY